MEHFVVNEYLGDLLLQDFKEDFAFDTLLEAIDYAENLFERKACDDSYFVTVTNDDGVFKTVFSVNGKLTGKKMIRFVEYYLFQPESAYA